MKKRKKRTGFQRGRWGIERERHRIDDPVPPKQIRDAEPIGSILSNVLSGIGVEDVGFARDIVDRWPELVGPGVASHTRPGEFVGKRLTVFVDSSVWLSELSRFGRRPMLRRLQAVYGEDRINVVTLRLDPGTG